MVYLNCVDQNQLTSIELTKYINLSEFTKLGDWLHEVGCIFAYDCNSFLCW